MTDPRPLCEISTGLDAWYFDYAGRAAMQIDPRPRLKRFAVHDGSRRRFGERTARPPLDLKLVGEETAK